MPKFNKIEWFEVKAQLLFYRKTFPPLFSAIAKYRLSDILRTASKRINRHKN